MKYVDRRGMEVAKKNLKAERWGEVRLCEARFCETSVKR